MPLFFFFSRQQAVLGRLAYEKARDRELAYQSLLKKVDTLSSKVSSLEKSKTELEKTVAVQRVDLEEKDKVMDNLRESVALSHTEKSNLDSEVKELRSLISEQNEKIKVQGAQLEAIGQTVKSRGSQIYGIYCDVLSKLGARSFGYKVTGEPEKFFDWLEGELKDLLEIIYVSGDYCARISTQALLETLNAEGCEHLKRIGLRDFKFPEGLGSTDCERTIEIITERFLRDFWSVKGRESARACAVTRLAKVRPRFNFDGAFFF